MMGRVGVGVRADKSAIEHPRCRKPNRGATQKTLSCRIGGARITHADADAAMEARANKATRAKLVRKLIDPACLFDLSPYVVWPIL